MANEVAQRDVWSKELVREIAMDIGKEIVAYVEVMYPAAITATSSTFKLSLRNAILQRDHGSDRGERRRPDHCSTAGPEAIPATVDSRVSQDAGAA